MEEEVVVVTELAWGGDRAGGKKRSWLLLLIVAVDWSELSNEGILHTRKFHAVVEVTEHYLS